MRLFLYGILGLAIGWLIGGWIEYRQDQKLNEAAACLVKYAFDHPAESKDGISAVLVFEMCKADPERTDEWSKTR